MRKRIIVLTLLFCLCCALPVYGDPNVMLNGKQAAVDAPPIIQDGMVLVPLRAIIEPLGGEIVWEEQTKTVFARRGSIEIALWPGSSDAAVNGRIIQLPTPVQTVNSRIMVPLQFIADILGADVSWDAGTQTAVINADVYTSPGIKSAARVHFIDVGQADAIYIQLRGNIDILIDGGNLDAEGVVLSYLDEQNLDDLELLIASNAEAHHIAALPAVLSEYEVEKLIYHDSLDQSSTEYLLSAAHSRNIPMEIADRQTYTWDDISFQILTGPADGQDNSSIVSRLKVGETAFLFMSDAGSETEKALSGDISAQVLKVGDHGSAAATSQEFLDRIKPQAAVITLAGDSAEWFGHDYSIPPADEVLDRLQSQGTTIFRTDLDGTIIVQTDGIDYDITTFAEDEPDN